MDATDELVLDESRQVRPERVSRLALLECPDLLAAAHELADEVSLWCDDLTGLAGSPAEVVADSAAAAVRGADLVWLRLPKSLAALDEYAWLVAHQSLPNVRLVAGGRVKYMTHSMNEVLATHFAHVSASLGRRKSRVLHAAQPRPSGGEGWPRSEHHADLGLTLFAHGATFGGTRVDAGTRLLLAGLDELMAALPGSERPLRVLDLGCGNGTIALQLARRAPHWQVLASDSSDSSVRATRLGAEANGLTLEAFRADGLRELPSRSLDVIVSNPPFHVGTAKDSSVALAMFEQAGRVLRPGGQFWCVFNSHLPWRQSLRQLGPTAVVAQNPKFTLTRTIAR